MRDYLNSHGLVGGDIPAGESCWCYMTCKWIGGNCPIPGFELSEPFSCGHARDWSLVQTILESLEEER